VLVTLTKKEGKPHVLRCRRNDGTETRFQASQSNTEFFAAHDLAHYVIERTLGYRTAFFGMVAAGRDINDFGSDAGSPGETLTAEAHWAEHLVNLILACVKDRLSYPEFADALKMVFPNGPAPAVTPDQFQQIVSELTRLLDQWNGMAVEASLNLQF